MRGIALKGIEDADAPETPRPKRRKRRSRRARRPQSAPAQQQDATLPVSFQELMHVVPQYIRSQHASPYDWTYKYDCTSSGANTAWLYGTDYQLTQPYRPKS